MSAEEINQLRQRLEEAERRREEAERRREEAERRHEEEQRRREAAEQRDVQNRERMSKTTLPNFLDGLHRHLSLGLQVQEKSQSTRGDPANAANKLRPD